jgi:2-deoxy-D-gluconate 3-dehydrogenase
VLITDHPREDDGAVARDQVEGLSEQVLARTPTGRWGLPEDLAGIAVFLASTASG